MSLLLIFALAFGLVAMLAMLIYAITQKSAECLFVAVGFLGVASLALERLI